MDDQVAAGVSNIANQPLPIWIEPWCDELQLPPRATLTLCVNIEEGSTGIAPIVEIDGDQLVVWASCPGTMQVFIDGVLQDTGSRTLALSAAIVDMPVKSFVELVFRDRPAARPGGRPLHSKPGWWLRSGVSRTARRLRHS